MPYDLHILKTFECADAVTLRVPARWTCGPHETAEGMWECYEEDEETGTLWINVDYFSPGEETPEPGIDELLQMIEGVRRSFERDYPDVIESSVIPAKGGGLFYRCHDNEEDGEPLRNFHYQFFIVHGAMHCSIGFNLVLPHSVLDDPEIRRLIEIVDREVRAARLEPFKREEREDAARALGSLQRCNFGNIVRLMLPETMNVSFHGGAEGTDPQWYGSMDLDDIHVGCWIRADESYLMSKADQGPASVSEEDYEAFFRNWLGEDAEKCAFERLPEGMIAREVFDDSDAGESEEALRKHVWQFMHFADDETCLFAVLLMYPYDKRDHPLFAELVTFLDREIPRAEFLP